MVKYTYKFYPALHVENTTKHILGEDWWKNHTSQMQKNIANSKLLDYAAVPSFDQDIDRDCLTITQIWDSVESKEQYNLDTNNAELTEILESLGYNITVTIEDI